MRRVLTRTAGWVVAIALVAAACGEDRTGFIEASGTVEATDAELGFQVGGRVARVLAREGDQVRAGDTLALLDRADLAARRDAALAQRDAQRARLAELVRGARPEEVAAARAVLDAAQQERGEARRDLTSARNLFAGGAISRQALERAETQEAIRSADADRAREQLRLVEQGPRAERLAAQRAVLAQADAAAREAEAALGFTGLVAPFAGTVSLRHREPGEIVAAGVPVITLTDLTDRWIRIYVPGPLVGRVSLGQPADIAIDASRDRTYPGTVAYIADQAEFTPRNVQTREERVKLVYRVKVRVVGDSALHLKPGLPADVRLAARP